MMKLEKLKKNKKRIIPIAISAFITFILTGIIFYTSFAFYEEKKDFNIINGTVEDPGDIYFAYYVNDVITRDFPNKDSGLTLDKTKSSCNSGVTITWDDNNWSAILNYSAYTKDSTTRTKCTLYFKEKILDVLTYVKNNADSTSTDVYTVPDKEGDSCTYTLAYDGTSDNNLRYVGSNPCNYVKIDNEIWRIIGLMNNIDDGTGKKETRIKLIRNEAIGTYSWDSSESSVNGSFGVNEWSQADLMKLLNPGYESESVGGSLYYNNSSGNCYYAEKNATKACDFTTTGIKANLKNLVGNTLWNTGSNGTNRSDSASNGLTSHFYSYERSSNNGKICTSGTYCTDTVKRTTTWNGKIGLMYPSDYGYATSGGSTSNRTSCLGKELSNWNSSSFSDCKNNDWLYNSSNWQWTISPVADSSGAIAVFVISNEGHVSSNLASIVNGVFADNQSAVRPSVYLIPSTSILGGEGTLENPYQIG